MEKFSVNRLAKMANVSVRTLHYYDEIGLLKPSLRSESNYRYYGREELLRLQQILLYRELDLSLSKIAEILDEENFDPAAALKEHHRELKKRRTRLDELMLTVEKTIQQLKTNNTMNYEELYKGFSKEQAEAYQKEALDRWGDKVTQSHGRLMAMSKKDWELLKQRGENIARELANHLHLPPDEKRVQQLVQQHYELMSLHFEVTPEIYSNMGNMYVEDARFKAYYDKYDEKLAPFLRDAIQVFCKNK